jgi:hypothetical protein
MVGKCMVLLMRAFRWL